MFQTTTFSLSFARDVVVDAARLGSLLQTTCGYVDRRELRGVRRDWKCIYQPRVPPERGASYAKHPPVDLQEAIRRPGQSRYASVHQDHTTAGQAVGIRW